MSFLAGKKKKGGLAVILGLRPGDHEESEVDNEEVDDEEMSGARRDAADALIESVHSKDPDGVAEAIQTLVDLCSSEHSEPEGDEDDEAAE